MSDSAIVLTDVWREFQDGKVTALRQISMQIKKGELVALVGPSGSGKSTLLNLMGTLDFASRGSVEILGHKVENNKSWESFRNLNIGYVFQLFHLIPELTLLQNVALALAPRKLAKAEILKKSAKCLAMVGLTKCANATPTEVSGGERQRAAIARALVTEPQIILADEPTGNLDSQSGAQVLDLLVSVSAAQNRTLILVTHNLEYARRMNRLIEIVDGRISC